MQCVGLFIDGGAATKEEQERFDDQTSQPDLADQLSSSSNSNSRSHATSPITLTSSPFKTDRYICKAV